MARGIITDREDLFSLENLYNAYLACRRNKRHTINALRFEANLLDNLCDLRRELVQRSYHPSTSICFVQDRPKLREIFAADFRDRVVHHLLVGYLEPVYERIFIHDSYACRVGRGVHGGITRLQSFLGKVTCNGTRQAWYLKEDIRGFFMNLDKNILYRMICRRTCRDSIRWLAAKIIFHDCTKDYSFKGQRSLLELIPPHKTLFKVGVGKGLPIGNLTSQFFANVYLNELDQFIKRELKCRYYLRYCDDFILLSESREQLVGWHAAIDRFLLDRLQLALNPTQYKLRPVSSGIDFLGYIVRRTYMLVRRRVVNHCREKLRQYEKKLGSKEKGEVVGWRYPPEETAAFRAVINSYLGHMQLADSHRLIKALFAGYPVLRAFFFLNGSKAVPRYVTGVKQGSLRRQYMWWLEKGLAYNQSGPGEDNALLIFFKAGRFYEMYGEQAEKAQDVLGLKQVPGLRGFQYGCGIHWRHIGGYMEKARRLGFHVALIGEERDMAGSIRRRLIRLERCRTNGCNDQRLSWTACLLLGDAQPT